MAEKMDIPGQEWVAQDAKPSEIDPKTGYIRKKVGWQKDQKKDSEAYRQGWDRIFGKKNDEGPQSA